MMEHLRLKSNTVQEIVINKIEDVQPLPSEPERRINSQLSPEAIEKIMKKVQDINEPETGLHSISQHTKSEKDRLDLLEEEMRSGILGMPYIGGEVEIEPGGAKWLEKVKKREGMFLFFSMIGREIHEVEENFWMDGSRKDPVAIIFDTNSFKQIDIVDITHIHDKNEGPALDRHSPKTFGTHGIEHFVEFPKKKIEKPPKSGKYVEFHFPDRDMGNALNFRVSPRFFKGIVFRLDREITPTEIKSRCYDSNQEITEEHDEVKIQKRVDEIVSRMRSGVGSREDRLVPVYDIHGNLWWPKRMSYDEVKRLASDEEKDNKYLV